MAVTAATFEIQRSADRHFSDHGWLQTRFSFSFADYFDPDRMHWGALRVFNDDRIAAGQGFPTHPHRDMEILTYVFDGKLEHRDTLGNHGIVTGGGVQFMSAGTGVRHSEFNGSAVDPLHLVQMWLLPGTLGSAPSYGQVDFTAADRDERWLTVATGEAGVAAPIALTQDASLRVARIATARLGHAFGAGRLGFLFVGAGSAIISATGRDGAPHAADLGAGDAVRLAGIEAIAVKGAAELVFWDIPDLAA